MRGRSTSAEGEELTQQTQQVERHEAFREGGAREQNLQQPLRQPVQELLQQEQHEDDLN